MLFLNLDKWNHWTIERWGYSVPFPFPFLHFDEGGGGLKITYNYLFGVFVCNKPYMSTVNITHCPFVPNTLRAIQRATFAQRTFNIFSFTKSYIVTMDT